MFPITPRSADGSNSRRGVCRAVYLANRRARSFAAKPPPAARLQERHKVGRRPEAGQVNGSFATQSTPKADIHRHDGDVRFVMNGHARRWSKAPPVAGSTFYLGVHPGCGSVKTPSPISYAVDFSKVLVGLCLRKQAEAL